MARIRRLRALAGLLVLLSPPVAGTAVPYFDPCPVDMPWLAAESTHGGHTGHDGSGQPASSGQHEGACHCLGPCAGGSGPANTPAGSQVLAADAGFLDPIAPLSRDPGAAPAPVRYLTPPATAPPVSPLT